MKSLFRAVVILLATNVLLPTAVNAADLQKGLAAYHGKDFASALTELMPLAEQGNTHAMFILGMMYRNGQGVVQDTTEADKWDERAFEEDSSFKDAPPKKDVIGEILSALDTGNTEKGRNLAIQALAVAPPSGKDFILWTLIEINNPKDVPLINDALESGVASGNRRFLELKVIQIERRLTLEPELKTELAPQLFKLLRALHAQGEITAAVQLAREYYLGELVLKNEGEALRLLRAAIADGSNQRAADQAEAYICSIVAHKSSSHFDLAEARNFCKRAADKGDEWAQVTLAQTYLDDAITEESKIGLSLLKQYSSNGNALAMTSLGWLLFSGEYGEFNSEEALSLTQKAADAGVAAALNNLGVMYSTGIITPKDTKLAYQYYSQAAEKGVDYAHANLAEGIFFREHEGVQVDFAEHFAAAKKISEKTDSTDGVTGLGVLGEIVSEIRRLPKDKDEAANLLTAKAIEGSAPAALQIAWNTDIADPSRRLEALKWFGIARRLARQDEVEKDAIDGARMRSRDVSKAKKKLVAEAAVSWLASHGFNSDGTLPPSMQGTLTFLTKDGVGVTASHVVRGCSNVDIIGVKGVNAVGRVLQNSSSLDIAIIKVAQSDIPLLPIRVEERPRQGENVSSFGYPTSAKDGSMASGIISATSGFKGENEEFQFSSPIQSGFSGGPVVDSDGKLLGVITKTLSTIQSGLKGGAIPQNANLAVNITEVVKLADVAHQNQSKFWKSWFSAADTASSLKAGTATVICNRQRRN
jgi:TPR repeat protein/S1-C subfamily serine protease